MVVSRGADGSAVCGRPLRGVALAAGVVGLAKTLPASRRIEPSLGDDMGDGSNGSNGSDGRLKVSAGIGVADPETRTGGEVGSEDVPT